MGELGEAMGGGTTTTDEDKEAIKKRLRGTSANDVYVDPQTGKYYLARPTAGGYDFDITPIDEQVALTRIALAERLLPSAKPFELTIPGKPSPYKGVSAEELPEWEPGFYKAAFERAQKPGFWEGPPSEWGGTPTTTIPGATWTTFPDGSEGWLLANGTPIIVKEAPKKTFDMSTPPNGVRQYTDPYGKVKTWSLIDPNTGRYDYIETGYDPTKDVSQTMTEYQKQQLELQRQGGERETTRLSYERQSALAAQQAAKEQRLAELAARPINWLQYAAETKTPPVVQPWMMPLSQEEYGWKVGQPIPGVSWGTRAQTVGQEPQFFSEEERQRYANAPTTPAPAGQDWRFFAGQWQLRNKEGAMAGSETLPTTVTGMDFSGIAEPLRPSTQLWARMAPSQQQGYYGLEQGRTGMTPEDIEFRRQSTLPPGGRAPRWVWSR